MKSSAGKATTLALILLAMPLVADCPPWYIWESCNYMFLDCVNHPTCDPNPNYPCPSDRTRYTLDCGGDRLVNYWCQCCTCA